MKLRKSYIGAGAVAMGAVLAFAVPAGASVNLQSESNGGSVIKIAKNAQIKAKGAATIVTVDVACPTGSQFDVSVNVTQAISGNKTSSGSAASYDNACTGGYARIKLPVLAGDAPFKKGVAYAVGQARFFDRNGHYVIADTGREIVNVQS